MQSSGSWVLVSVGMTNEFVELGAASTDSALDSDLADTELHDAANQAARGIPPWPKARPMPSSMAYSIGCGLQHGLWPMMWPIILSMVYALQHDLWPTAQSMV